MLFKIKDLKGIKAGSIGLAFRKWKKPSVKTGTLLKTAIGQVEVLDITTIDINKISLTDALNAGSKNLEALLNILNSRKEGKIYKIKIQYHSSDPRIELRQQTELSGKDLEDMLNKLARFDKFSKQGPWTFKVLNSIKENPQLRAKDLAEILGHEKDWLKPNVHKLKNLGLTISHGVGYSLSPRGEIIFEKLINAQL